MESRARRTARAFSFFPLSKIEKEIFGDRNQLASITTHRTKSTNQQNSTNRLINRFNVVFGFFMRKTRSTVNRNRLMNRVFECEAVVAELEVAVEPNGHRVAAADE